MQKALIIIGPTATGKTALGIQLAKKLNGVIFSADSVQVYEGLDIVSGKDLSTLTDISTRLLDIASPTAPFSVSDFAREFQQNLENIPQDTITVIVGGTGFYVRALLEKINTIDVKPNKKLREILGKDSVEQLKEKLEKVNPEKLASLNNSDRNNPRRLVRAIEIANSKWQIVDSRENGILKNYNIKIVGLKASREILRKRIGERVEQRLKEGALGEARNLFKQYDLLAPQVKTANGYKQLFAYLKNELTLTVAIAKWKTAEIQNAKKQMTFFKKLKNVEWFNIADPKFSQKVEDYVCAW